MSLQPPPAPESSLRSALKLGMVGCGSVLLAGILIVSLAVAVVSSHPRSMRATLVLLFDYEEQSILGHADGSATGEDRKEFREAYARFRSAWLAGLLDSGDTAELRKRMMTELQKDTFRGEDLRSLARFFDRMAGGKRIPAPAPPPGSVAA